MKKLFFTLVVSVLFVCILEQKAEPEAQKIELKFISNYMESHKTVKDVLNPWMKKVDEISGGKVKIHFFSPNTLCSAKDVYDSVVTGIADIGSINPGYTPGKFRLLEVLELPMITTSAESGAMINWELYQRFPEWREQQKDTKILWYWAATPFQVCTVKKPVRTLQDLAGLKMIVWNDKSAQIVKLLGANPIQMSSPDTYLALERGMADGVFAPLAPLKSTKISDITRHYTIIDSNNVAFSQVMNINRFNNLPPDIKSFFDKSCSAQMSSLMGKSLDQGVIDDIQWMESKGHTFYTLTPEEKKRWVEKLKLMHGNWVKSMEARGYTKAREILNEAVKLGQEYTGKTGKGYEGKKPEEYLKQIF
jgi:TRAP-type C4-dicarboxylate transport system substrate-binding protein